MAIGGRGTPHEEPVAVTSSPFTRAQWGLLIAAWLGWGFDAFDALLFNYAAPTCVPVLLGIELGTPEARSQTLFWTGVMTSILLVGWAVGGVLFGKVADQYGRTRCLVLTIGMYALATAASAFAPNIWVLAVLRFVAALGIGGEWAAGAALVAEVVPERLRVEAGALLYTAAPLGVMMAGVVNSWISGTLLAQSPASGWRYVFACGLLPALLTLGVRWFVREPESPQASSSGAPRPRLSAIFADDMRARTITGTVIAFGAMLTWWSCNAFAPLVFRGLAQQAGADLQGAPLQAFVEQWQRWGSYLFNLGGIVGVLLTVPIAKAVGRKAMFFVFFIASAASILVTFGLQLAPLTRIVLYFAIGLTIYGVFGSFTYYLPELFPRHIRATGAGFCYNVGRLVAAAGPFLVGAIAASGSNALQDAMRTLFWTGFIPLLALTALPWVHETRDRALE